MTSVLSDECVDVEMVIPFRRAQLLNLDEKPFFPHEKIKRYEYWWKTCYFLTFSVFVLCISKCRTCQQWIYLYLLMVFRFCLDSHKIFQGFDKIFSFIEKTIFRFVACFEMAQSSIIWLNMSLYRQPSEIQSLWVSISSINQTKNWRIIGNVFLTVNSKDQSNTNSPQVAIGQRCWTWWDSWSS